ncbi:MAG: aspartate carbamoyltransferase regulatory subunit [Candidatus Diapherotrites archaeon CG10_big_fil_rev_8_21_14_0_10_31_34]|nr:MAG: aspartate carbamoyltransferase regulatory subunit [Candidatus Diapherotrites archaeon CG10_big_fil_rev_8_21_14_0_10_31_34]PJA17319.1 MAG: aspartate carbamoyltransferase regulatory subunit [Candidatus Diapherotrites archaeon CG_4_10_14_0_2_um_filter_31_5]
MTEKEEAIKKLKIRVTPIGNGTAIDHIRPGMGLRIVEILGMNSKEVGAIALNTETQKRKEKRKDLILMENRFLTEEELNKIKLLARDATVNTIKNYKVTKKERLGLPTKVQGVLECINPNCITNHEEIKTMFFIKKNPVQAKCFYCETAMDDTEIEKYIKK